MKSLPHHLDRTVVIQADREIVFRYFTDSERWAAWWGAGSSIDARPGGPVSIRHWRYQLSVFGNVVANDVHAGAAEVVDAWFAAWSEPDAADGQERGRGTNVFVFRGPGRIESVTGFWNA